MRRWTVLLIPHDTDQPRSIAVTERALKWATSLAAVVIVAAFIGVGALGYWVSGGRPWGRSQETDTSTAALSEDETRPAAATSSAEFDSLSATVEALNRTLDTIRETDARLSAAAGVPPADSATMRAHAALRGTRASADSLLRGATLVAGRLGKLADSAGNGVRRGAVVRRLPPPSRSSAGGTR